MTLENKYIFILGAVRFDGHDQSTSLSVAKELAKKNFVYYIDYPYTWKDYLTFRNTSAFKKRKPLFSPFSDGIIPTEAPNFRVIITPPLLSINFLPEGFLYRSILRLNEMIIRNRIKKVLKNEKITDYIYINTFNFHYPGIADLLDPQLTVYYCFDPMIMEYDIVHGVISENSLVKESDVVLCTSKQLRDEKMLLNQNTYFIPNAADISQSMKALDNGLPVNESIAKLKKPIIGYVGTIERRIDYELLKEVVTLNKNKNFVFAGPVSPEFVPEWFTKTKNIHLLGRIPYEELPGVVKGFDAAIIPFKKDKVSSTIFPLKLFEYLGAGKPVISTDFNTDLKEFTENSVAYCSDAKTFSEAIDNCLNEGQDMLQKRLEVAANNTWQKRCEQISQILGEKLSGTD